MPDIIYQNKNLDEWLFARTVNDFPETRNFGAALIVLKNYLIDNIYEHIVTSALYQSFIKGKKLIYLNNHGKDHVDQVIDRLSELLRAAQFPITHYEAYLLLFATYIHDIGNIFGRDEHEKKCNEIIGSLQPGTVYDRTEQRFIYNIASSHGGKVNGDDDTLKMLEDDDLLDQKVRIPMLAALLRFADELADDRKRTSKYMVANRLFPLYSQIYHAYSHSLRSVSIGGRDITLKYEINRSTAITKYKHPEKREPYLIDEIYHRTYKMYRESRYCNQYLPQALKIERIKVSIAIYNDTYQHPIYETIVYTLPESSGPKIKCESGIFKMVPSLEKLTGTKIARELRKK